MSPDDRLLPEIAAAKAAELSADGAALAKVEISHVCKAFRRTTGEYVQALADVSLSIPDNRFVSLLGPSGCGKTTLLRMINGLIQPDRGSIRVSGAPPRPGPQTSLVFQSFRLIPWQTVRNNVAFGLAITGMPRAERLERADRYLALVGLQRFADVYPSELSGGMKQRAALARALATDPEILLMDEPLASLDAQSRELMQIELMRIWSKRRGVVLFVTHSVDEAILLADQVVLMGPRPGRIVETIDIDLPRPRWTYDARSRSDYLSVRQHLSTRLRDMVLSDPDSDFYMPS
jgi:NitT/TauT family transport system ATP-binding protein